MPIPLYPAVVTAMNELRNSQEAAAMMPRTVVDRNPELFINTQVPEGYSFPMIPVETVPVVANPVVVRDLVDRRLAALYGAGIGALGGLGIGALTGGTNGALVGSLVGAGAGAVTAPLVAPYLVEKLIENNIVGG